MKYFIVLVILLFLSISVVNASDNTTDDMTSNTLETTPPVEKVVTSTEEQIQKESLNINTTSKEKVINKKSTLQNTKTDSVPISNYTTLNDTLTSDASTDVTIDIGDNITLQGSIEINSAIKTITINGNQYTINGNRQYQFLVIPSGTTVDINNITITNCKALTGGAINNSGNLTITNTTFNNNQAEQKGGAIYNGADANITLTGNTFRHNTAPEASAIMNEGNINKLENSVFKDNNPDNFIIENNVITLNSTDGFITVGDFTIITDDDEINGTENLDQHTISSDYKNLKLILNGTDSKTVNNIFMFKETKEITITGYSELVAAIEDAKINEYDQYIINLLSGNYNATQTIIWSNSATRDIIIKGNNNTLDGQGLYQFIDIAKGHDLTVENITFTNYDVSKTDDDDNRPGNGAVAYVDGKLTVNNAQFINNSAVKRGGAIYNYGTVIVNNTLFENNTARRYDGGAIANYGPLTISNTIFRGNKATDQGGAIYLYHGTLNVTESVFENNTAGSKGGAICDLKDCVYQYVSYCNFTNNSANGRWYSGGAIYASTGHINATGNIFIDNHASTGETLDFNGWWAPPQFSNNTYISTDIRIKGMTITTKDDQTTFNSTDNITLSYNIELQNGGAYKDFKTGIRGITLYIDGKENQTTNYEDITINDLNPGNHTAYFTLLGRQSSIFKFDVIGDSEISTPDSSYEYVEGVNTKIPLNLIDASSRTGLIIISVKEQDTYQELSASYYLYGYALSTEALADTLKTFYGTLDSSYTINLTYFSQYTNPSSTEFTLNINKEKNTTIIYNILNNTVGNVQINITVQETITRTPIPEANIQITGDITKNTVSGILTDNTLTVGEHTITVQFPQTGNYKASETTINFNVEVDKDKIIEELKEDIEYYNKSLQSNMTALKETEDELNKTKIDLDSNITALEKAEADLAETQANLDSNITALNGNVTA